MYTDLRIWTFNVINVLLKRMVSQYKQNTKNDYTFFSVLQKSNVLLAVVKCELAKNGDERWRNVKRAEVSRGEEIPLYCYNTEQSVKCEESWGTAIILLQETAVSECDEERTVVVGWRWGSKAVMLSQQTAASEEQPLFYFGNIIFLAYYVNVVNI